MTETLTMGQRRAGQAAIEDLLRHHRHTRSRSAVARVFGRSPLSAESEALHRDALAQIAVGGVLERLPPEWTVFSSAPGRMDAAGIDHVVIGPGGLFTVNSKLHVNRTVWVADSILVVDRTTLGHIPDAILQARRLTEVLGERMPLPAPVRPMVAIVDAKRITIRERSEQVLVLDARSLNHTLTSLPVVLDASELRQIRSILNDPESWNDGLTGGTGVGATGTGTVADSRAQRDELLAEFAALDSEILIADARRSGWKLAAYAVAVVTPIAAFPYLVDMITALAGR